MTIYELFRQEILSAIKIRFVKPGHGHNRLLTGANTFNQPIGEWDTGKVTEMSLMFLDATAFEQYSPARASRRFPQLQTSLMPERPAGVF